MVCVGGVVSSDATTDHEEKEQCIKMHELITQYSLDGEFRCVMVGSLLHIHIRAFCMRL